MKEHGVTKIEVLNINHPGKSRKVDAAIYVAVRAAYLSVLPRQKPGLTIREAESRLHHKLSASLFGGSAQLGWWSKTVQLDLEARRLIARTDERPLRLHRT